MWICSNSHFGVLPKAKDTQNVLAGDGPGTVKPPGEGAFAERATRGVLADASARRPYRCNYGPHGENADNCRQSENCWDKVKVPCISELLFATNLIKVATLKRSSVTNDSYC